MAINRKDWTPTSSSRICHLHFKTSDYSNTAGKVLQLKPDVVHTLNLHYVNANKDTLNGHNIEDGILSDTTEFISHTSEVDKTTQADDIIFNLREAGKGQKRKSNEMLQSVNNKCCKLEKENEELKLMINSLTVKYEQQLRNQVDMFRTLIKNEKEALKQKLIAERSKTCSLSKKNNRMQSKLESVIKDLKSNKVVSNETYDILSSEMQSVSSCIFENECKNLEEGTGRRYSKDKRTMFKLPHPSSMCNWMSNVNVQPGFQLKVLQALSKLEATEQGCCLMFDSMAIRQQITWSEEEHRFIGFGDYEIPPP